jgi:phasin family protein
MAEVFTKGLFNPAASYQTVQKLNAINLKTFTRLAGLQLDLAKLGLATTVEQAQLLAEAGTYEEICFIETRLASDYGSRLLDISQETTGLLFASHDEYFAVIEAIFAVAREHVEVADSTGTAVKKTRSAVKTAKTAKRKAARKN